ncbi:hypothetical protein HYV71_03445 [Candidatus Uhrbacteria bacterium]|nr:hypothetical protein [Candidatus Uhrbacteria bacterium]
MFTPLSSLLPNAAQRAHVTRGVTLSLALERVNAVLCKELGESRRHRVQAAYVKYRALTISVSDASIGALLQGHEQEILHTLNFGCPQPLASRIQVILEAPQREE